MSNKNWQELHELKEKVKTYERSISEINENLHQNLKQLAKSEVRKLIEQSEQSEPNLETTDVLIHHLINIAKAYKDSIQRNTQEHTEQEKRLKTNY